MDKNKYTTDERGLAERLRREAEADRPAFSEELHQRICLMVEQSDVPSPPKKASPTGRRVWVAIAATIVLAGTVLLAWRPPGPEVVEIDNTEEDATLAAVSEELEGLTDVTQLTTDGALRMDLALTTEGWADLDHDARLATELVLNQLPLDMLASSEEP